MDNISLIAINARQRSSETLEAGYRNHEQANVRLEKTRGLIEIVGGSTLEFNRSASEMIGVFRGSERVEIGGVVAALISQKGFPSRRGIKVGLVTKADSQRVIRKYSVTSGEQLARKLVGIARPGEIVVTEDTIARIEDLLKMHLDRDELVLLTQTGFATPLFDIARVIESRFLKPVAKALESLVIGKQQTVKPIAPFTIQLRRAVERSGPYQAILHDVINTAIAATNVEVLHGGGSRGRPPSGGSKGKESTEKDSSRKSKSSDTQTNRFVSAGLEDGDLPMLLNRPYTVYVEFGAKSRTDALGGGKLPRLDWGKRTEIELMANLRGEGLDFEPEWQVARLEKNGEDVTLHFRVTARRAGKLMVTLSIFLKREMLLLERYDMVLEAMEAPAEAVE